MKYALPWLLVAPLVACGDSRTVDPAGALDPEAIGEAAVDACALGFDQPEVSGIDSGDVVQFDLADGYGCALLQGGVIRCWGYYPDFEEVAPRAAKPPATIPVPEAVQVATGDTYACALSSSGGVTCWGWGAVPGAGAPAPTTIDGLGDVVELAAGAGLACARRRDGSVRCWGSGENYNVEALWSDEPFDVVGVTDAVALAIGGTRVCALLGDSTAACWGIVFDPDSGMPLPMHQAAPLVDPARTPLTGIEELSLSRSIQRDSSRGCARLSTGVTQCWRGDLFDLIPTEIPELAGASSLAVGTGFECAVVPSGDGVRCLGDAARFLRGPAPAPSDGAADESAQLVDVPDLSGVQELHAGGTYACARNGEGMRCWGDNGAGQLGSGAPAGVGTVPVAVVGVSGAVDVDTAQSVDGLRTCVVSAEGELFCWTRDTTPTRVLTGVAAVATSFFHACARMRDGSVECWGGNQGGVLGDGTTDGYTDVPVAVVGIDRVIELAVSGTANCVLREDGRVWCWGSNGTGLLGASAGELSGSPLRVEGVEGATALALGGLFDGAVGCAVVGEGDVLTWGRLDRMEPSVASVPRAVQGLAAPAVAVFGHERGCCALLDDGRVDCWDDTDAMAAPLSGLEDVVDLSFAIDSLCAITAECGASCYTLDRSDGWLARPSYRSGLSDAVRVSTAGARSCAATAAGAFCWGERPLGDGVEAFSATPVPLLL